MDYALMSFVRAAPLGPKTQRAYAARYGDYLADNPHLDPEVWCELYTPKCSATRAEILISNHRLDPARIERILEVEKRVGPLRALVCHPDVTGDALRRIATMAVASKPRLAVELIEHSEVLNPAERVALVKGLPLREVLNWLAATDPADVAADEAMALVAQAPDDKASPWAAARWAALLRPDLVGSFAASEHPALQTAAAGSVWVREGDADLALVERWKAQTLHHFARSALIANPMTRPEAVKEFASAPPESETFASYYARARHPERMHLIEDLAEVSDPEVLGWLMSRLVVTSHETGFSSLRLERVLPLIGNPHLGDDHRAALERHLLDAADDSARPGFRRRFVELVARFDAEFAARIPEPSLPAPLANVEAPPPEPQSGDIRSRVAFDKMPAHWLSNSSVMPAVCAELGDEPDRWDALFAVATAASGHTVADLVAMARAATA